jgi:hypothetical protein
VKYFILAALASLSFNAFGASMSVKSGQFGMKFENKTGDKELEISNISPMVVCSTTYVTIFGNLGVDQNKKELKSVHYPDSLHVGTEGLSYVQLNISGPDKLEAPDRLFDREKYCEFGIHFDALVVDDKTGEQVTTGTVNALLIKTDREDVNIIDELNALKVMKFKVQTSPEGKIEFALDGVGVFPLI